MFFLEVTRLYRDLAAGVSDCKASAREISGAQNLSSYVQLSTITRDRP